MGVLFSNFAMTTLAIGCSDTATTVSLTDASGMPNPGAGDYFYLVFENDLKQREIVKVTSRSGNTITMVRAQEGTTAREWEANDLAWQTLTKQGIADLKAELETAIDEAKAEAIAEGSLAGYPIGAVVPWPLDTIPASLLEFDASAVSRTTYSAVFAIYGTAFGVGDGVTTFNLPDWRSRVPRGRDHGAGRDPDAATRLDRGDGTTGDHAGTYQADAIKKHMHPMGANTGKADGGATVVDPGSWGTYQHMYTGDFGRSDADIIADYGSLVNFARASETRMANVAVVWCVKWR